MKSVKTIKLNEADIWQMKRDQQARDRQLVKDGISTQESMFLISRDLVKQSKVKHRGL